MWSRKLNGDKHRTELMLAVAGEPAFHTSSSSSIGLRFKGPYHDTYDYECVRMAERHIKSMSEQRRKKHTCTFILGKYIFLKQN